MHFTCGTRVHQQRRSEQQLQKEEEEEKREKSINRFTCANKLPACRQSLPPLPLPLASPLSLSFLAVPLPSHSPFHSPSSSSLSLAVAVSVFHCVCQHSLGLIFRLQHKLKLTEETQAKAVASTERGVQRNWGGVGQGKLAVRLRLSVESTRPFILHHSGSLRT